MRKITFLRTMLVTSTVMLTSISISGQTPFGNNNLGVLVAASSSANNTTVSVVEINKTAATQTAIQTISILGTGTNAIRVSGSATSTLYAANSNDGSLFCFTGHNSEVTASNANTITSRAVVAVNNAGNYSLPTTYTGASGSQTRGATTTDNTNFYIADQGGQFTNGASTASPIANIRGMKSFGGTVYLAQNSSTSTVIEISSTSAITGGTITGLPGLTNNSTIFDFYLISSGTNGSSYDVLYILRSTTATAGTIAKYSLVSGTWTANGTYTTTFGGFGLAAENYGSGGAYLYATTGTGATAANSVIKLTDAAGYNSLINITTASNVTLYTAATGTTIKGVTFAPKPFLISVVEPSVPTMSSTVLSQILTVNGTNLTGDISLAISGTNSSAFTVTPTLTQSGGTVVSTPVTINFVATANGSYSAVLTLSSPGSASKTFNLNASISTGIMPVAVSSAVYNSNGNIAFTASAGQTVEIFNTVGQKLLTKTTVNGLNTIQLSAKGIVLVKVGNRISKIVL